MAERTPPHSIEAEQALAGAVLLAGTEALERIGGICRPDDCYSPQVQYVLEAALELSARGQPIDLVTLEDELKRKDRLGRVGGIDALSELAEKTPTAENVGHHARLVRDRAQLRKLISVSREVASRAYACELSADELCQDAADQISSCFSSELGGRSIQEVVGKVHREAEARTELINQGREHEMEDLGVSTGLYQLDAELTLGGLPLGHPTLLGADTSTGKTALATHFLWSVARRGEGGLYCTLEDDAESPTLRMISSLSRLPNRDLQNLRVRPQDWPSFEHAAGELWSKRIHFFERPQPVDDLVGKVLRYCRRHDPRLVVVDYAQLLEPAERARSRQEEVDDTMKRLTAMAAQLKGAATVIVSQFHRRDGNAPPTCSDFYHSAAIEQSAHTILLLWKPPLKAEWPCRLVVIGKQKNGPAPRSVVVGWEGITVSFFNADAAKAEGFLQAIAQLAKGGKGKSR